MTALEFIRKWQHVSLTERSACQQHFLDLCDLLGHPKPAEMDPTGDSFTFEKGAGKQEGGQGWADVWKKGFFGWEYKGPHAKLAKAYSQLLQYREALENPPLLVVCDMDRMEIRTNFTGTRTEVHSIPLVSMDTPRSQEILHALFFAPDKLKPGATSAAITTAAAAHIGEIARRLRERGEEPAAVARFLDRIVFCLFAEDIQYLPDDLFNRLLQKTKGDPPRFKKMVGDLFTAMATGGDFGMDTIRHFDGALFAESPALLLNEEELSILAQAATLDWSAVDPSIFGTLFERGLDPAKRAQLGAHYTSREDIEALVEPVVFAPLRREWAQVKAEALAVLAPLDKQGGKPPTPQAVRKIRDKASALVGAFLLKLHSLTVLDPACGSGNFLYVTLQKLKDLEKEVGLWAMNQGLGLFLPLVHPRQLYGIEINPYAYDLAQMTVWIGYLQWIKANGFGTPSDPILEPLAGNFQNKDAILGMDRSLASAPTPENGEGACRRPLHRPIPGPREPEWPEVDCIVSNPPFLGGKLLRSQLGDEYVDNLFQVWDGRVPREADLCCYWHEKARAQIEKGLCKRAGLLATQGIRGGANRKVLERIKETGGIFFAESDRPWILDGANVHVSMVGFDGGEESNKTLDGKPVAIINANLTYSADITLAKRLNENLEIAFMGDTKGGSFDIEERLALEFLLQPNPHGRPNSDVVVPWVNGLDVTRRPRSMWIVDFGAGMKEEEAAKYEAPFEYVRQHVKPERDKNNREVYRRLWWQHVEARPGMRKSLDDSSRFLATPNVTKHRLFIWMGSPTLPDHQLIVFARSDDYFFGVLHSRFHEIWALKLGTRLETRPRYTPTTCFETFPFPNPTEAQKETIAEAARELNALREAWLNPPEWTKEETLEFPGSLDGPWARYIGEPAQRAPSEAGLEGALGMTGKGAIGTVRYPRLVPKDETCAAYLKKRTLTNLYNQRPTWLALAHQKLDEAVAAAYALPWDLSPEDILARLLYLNLQRSKGDNQGRT